MSDQNPSNDPLSDQADPQSSAEDQSSAAVPATPATPAKGARPAKSKRASGEGDSGGIPLWLPLAALVIALLFALFIASRIGPTLSALVAPPEPVLPPESVLQSHTSNGTEDQWLYNTKTDGCRVAHLYAAAFGACIYDPSSGCSNNDSTPGTNGLGLPGVGNEIAECSGTQTIANYHLAWRVYIGTSGGANSQTYFRVYREAS